jgi:hypothetical protein
MPEHPTGRKLERKDRPVQKFLRLEFEKIQRNIVGRHQIAVRRLAGYLKVTDATLHGKFARERSKRLRDRLWAR